MHSFISNFKKIMYVIFSLAIIFLCCISFLAACFKVTCPAASYMFDFYEMDNNSFDVINVGSSHVYCSINTIEMYRRRGITSYNLAAGSQSVWFSYYYIKEALKTQKPKIILLDVYTVNVLEDDHFIAKTQMNILDMKPSFNKFEAIQSSGSDGKWNIFWGFPKFHSRYRELTVGEYGNDVCRNMMGYSYMPSAEPKDNAEVEDISRITDTLPISPKAELYLRKCIELCQKEKIEIILVNAPWSDITQDAEQRYNYVQKIASEYGVDFIDGNRIYDQIGIDYRVDNAEGGHLSYTGSLKWTNYLLDYLVAHYELPDHRGEQKIWEDSVAALDNLLAKEQLRQIDTSDEYFRYLTEETTLPYVVIVQPKDGLTEGKGDALQAAGLSLGGDERGYILRLPDGELRARNNIYSDKQLYAKIYDDLVDYSDQDDAYHNIVMQYTKEIADNRTTDGVCYVVFDPFSYQTLDIVEFREEAGYCRIQD